MVMVCIPFVFSVSAVMGGWEYSGWSGNSSLCWGYGACGDVWYFVGCDLVGVVRGVAGWDVFVVGTVVKGVYGRVHPLHWSILSCVLSVCV